MTSSVARLQRLHALRCRLADAAAADRERIAQQVQGVDQVLSNLERMKASALHRNNGDAPSSWCERAAELQIATCQHQTWSSRREEWIAAKEAALVQERAAVQEREQVGSILEKRQAEIATAQSRREQARLDDLFATARVRSAMATAF